MTTGEPDKTAGRSSWDLWVLFGALLVVGGLAVAMAVRWAHSSGSIDDDTNGEILAVQAICTGCAGIASFLAATAVAHRLGVRRAMRDIETAMVLDR